LGARVGVVTEKPGDVRECACAGPQRRAERAELTGLAHGAEREKRGTLGATARRLAIRVREIERERERAGKGKLVPTDRPHWAASEREGAREGELPLQAGSACQGRQVRGRAAWLGLTGPAGLLSLFLFPWIF
jgi:hypothetical protein